MDRSSRVHVDAAFGRPFCALFEQGELLLDERFTLVRRKRSELRAVHDDLVGRDIEDCLGPTDRCRALLRLLATCSQCRAVLLDAPDRPPFR